MNRWTDRLKRVPWWGWCFGIGYLALEYGLYRAGCDGARLSHVLGTASHAFVWKIAPVDDLIPVVPFFVVIYVFSYVFWVCGIAAVSLTGKRRFANYICGLTLAYVVGFMFFTFMPTRMDRVAEGLMRFDGRPGLFDRLLAFIYRADGGGTAYNLFPSYHCMISVHCYLGVRRREEFSKGFRVYTFAMMVLILLSTLYTKQHYIPDIFGGAAVAIACWALMNRLDPGKRFERGSAPRRGR